MRTSRSRSVKLSGMDRIVLRLCMFLFACYFLWPSDALSEVYSKGHDGSTVSRLLSGGRGTDDASCPAEGPCKDAESELCWGYEKGCTEQKRLFVPRCDEPAKPWAGNMEVKHELFWHQGDFGYVKGVVDSMMTLCKPKSKYDSFLKCSAHMRFCKARNLYLDLRRFKEISQTEGTYRSFLEDVFREGEVGGHCRLDAQQLRKHGDHKSPLQSWYAELEQFTQLDFRPTKKEHCDEIVTKPTVFIKLDSGVNLYHHFCDFFNLYASQHVNGSFTDDIYIVRWDTSYDPYPEIFGDAWRAFTRHPLKRLADFEGKRMCFNDVVFPLLARMRNGLYYSTYLVPGCYGSGLMQAFSKHIVPLLGAWPDPSPPTTVRVTLLSRSTNYRRITNEEELVKAMKTVGFLDVRVVDYKYKVYPFLEQVQSSHNSDIFMGMHGSGLAHMIFLPDWAGVFEIYNTEDPECYRDLARLRGIQYITWEDHNKLRIEAEGVHPTMGIPHAKFNDYSFDVEEFMRLVIKLADGVLERKMAVHSQKIL